MSSNRQFTKFQATVSSRDTQLSKQVKEKLAKQGNLFREKFNALIKHLEQITLKLDSQTEQLNVKFLRVHQSYLDITNQINYIIASIKLHAAMLIDVLQLPNLHETTINSRYQTSMLMLQFFDILDDYYMSPLNDKLLLVANPNPAKVSILSTSSALDRETIKRISEIKFDSLYKQNPKFDAELIEKVIEVIHSHNNLNCNLYDYIQLLRADAKSIVTLRELQDFYKVFANLFNGYMLMHKQQQNAYVQNKSRELTIYADLNEEKATDTRLAQKRTSLFKDQQKSKFTQRSTKEQSVSTSLLKQRHLKSVQAKKSVATANQPDETLTSSVDRKTTLGC